MKKIISILFLVLFLSVTFQETTIFVFFKLNQSSIIKDFCVNKEKPELECKGTCHLKKQIGKNQEKQNDNKISRERLEIQFYSPLIDIELNTRIILSEIESKEYKMTSFIMYSTIFHPPQFV